MARKTENELATAEALAVQRTLIRLKHKFEADRELNDARADLEAQIDDAIQNGEEFTLDISRMLGLPE